MTHAYLALKEVDIPFKTEKGCQYIMSEKSAKEFNMKELIKKKIVKELSEEEALKNYKLTLTN
jgi:hypothetical protein